MPGCSHPCTTWPVPAFPLEFLASPPTVLPATDFGASFGTKAAETPAKAVGAGLEDTQDYQTPSLSCRGWASLLPQNIPGVLLKRPFGSLISTITTELLARFHKKFLSLTPGQSQHLELVSGYSRYTKGLGGGANKAPFPSLQPGKNILAPSCSEGKHEISTCQGLAANPVSA